MPERPTTIRNRAIFSAAASGQSLEQLAEIFCLAPLSIRAIVADEGHRRAVSLDVYYRDMRRPQAQKRADERRASAS
ncbi:MAG: hypothetical protein JWP16_1095 [Alphaproteobacteria bacterium]|jgi:hypothetical protein|nr:hypothetical protein [Alphaproteobacteria bacterium]MDB5740055.1 hypothetical protein [Alphaproteobacteria bacterium]